MNSKKLTVYLLALAVFIGTEKGLASSLEETKKLSEIRGGKAKQNQSEYRINDSNRASKTLYGLGEKEQRKDESRLLAQSLNATALEKQAQQFYETGQWNEAIALLQRLGSDYAARGDFLGEARQKRNLSLVYQQLGDRAKAERAIADSLDLLERSPNSQERTRLLALALESRGQLQLTIGQSQQALDTWKKAASTYEQIGDTTGVLRSRLNQTQALQALGLYSQAVKTLSETKLALDAQPDSLLKARALQSLGEALRVVGKLKESEEVLSESSDIAERLQDREVLAAIFLSSGNTARVAQKPDVALEFYQRAVEESPTLTTKVEAQLNQISLAIDHKKWSDAKNLVPQTLANIRQFPPSQKAVYARINLARSLMKYEAEKTSEKTLQNSEFRGHIPQLLASAVHEADSLSDRRAMAYALGNLALLYEQNQQWSDARQLTEKALLLAQAMNAADIAYQWQWQLGRILKQQGEREGAIAAYNQAVKTLQSLRSDLVAISSDVQFSFRENVEPVYRELVGLLVQNKNATKQSDLVQARQVIESLQLAELDNFFRDACLDTKPAQIDQIDKTAAIFYTIILGDRLEVIAALPGQPLRHHTTNLPQEEIEQTLTDMRDAITIPRLRLSLKSFLQPSQKVYDWVIRPFEADLASSGIKTLVFVLDGSLRNIPIAALHDGTEYVAQKYSVAIAPGLQLVDPKPLARQKLQILTAGLSEARQGFSPLPGVETELDRIKAEAPTQLLLNQSFTEANFKKILSAAPYPVVHLATHGEFSSQAENTFILTWDNKINAKELDRLLRTESGQKNPIELLVFSACRTAAGDKRAALGLAGVAVRAGARSTLASLWYVSDRATSKLMTQFYEELAKGDVTKAEALRRAQQAVLQDGEFSHPYYWSAFMLVGNWL